MALTWDWKNKVGEATLRQKIGDEEYEDFTVSLYEVTRENPERYQ